MIQVVCVWMVQQASDCLLCEGSLKQAHAASLGPELRTLGRLVGWPAHCRVVQLHYVQIKASMQGGKAAAHARALHQVHSLPNCQAAWRSAETVGLARQASTTQAVLVLDVTHMHAWLHLGRHASWQLMLALLLLGSPH